MEKRALTGTLVTVCLILLNTGAGMPAAVDQKPALPSAPAKPAGRLLQTQPDFGKMPLNFIPNLGQLDERVAYYIQGKDKTIYFGPEGVTLALATAGDTQASNGSWIRRSSRSTPTAAESPDFARRSTAAGPRASLGDPFPPYSPVALNPRASGEPKARPLTPPANRGDAGDGRWVVKLDFLGVKPGVRPVGMDKTGGIISDFRGKPENWKTGLPAYSRIIYPDLWPGIDLAYSGTMDALKYEFIVHPGADPSRIKLAYRGATSVIVDRDGRLVVSTPSGGFSDGVPVAYQDIAGTRVSIPMAYALAESAQGRTEQAADRKSEGNSRTYGFSVGPYDPTKPLVLDPVILIYCGYIGGPSYDYGYGIAADHSGNAYIAGYTYSPGGTFPVKSGPDTTHSGGNVDAFVAKLNAAGTAFIYCGYIGGAGNDFGYGIAVDNFGCAYVTGYTSSTEATFPVSVGPILKHRGAMDAFVAKVNAAGTSLDYCGFVGGSGNDYGRGIAVDGTGHAYIAGSTDSPDVSFPAAVGPDLMSHGNWDVFVAKVNVKGSELDYCGFIGGGGEDVGNGIAVDGLDCAYVTGYTYSTETAFPVVEGPDLTQGGLADAFIAKVGADGTALLYCGYIGGAGNDFGAAVAVDLSGNAYVTGYTASPESSLPVLIGPSLTYAGGTYDAFVAKVNNSGIYLDYLGYIGGAQYDAGTGIAVDAWGYAYVTGYTSSKEDSFPVKQGPILTQSGSFDAFAAKVAASGKELVFCGYLGGSESDVGTGIALDADGSGNIFLTGNTYSSQTTFPVAVGPGFAYHGSRDGFVAKIYENMIVLTSPNGGEIRHARLIHNITWLTTGKVGNVRLEFSTDKGETWEIIAASTENDGHFAWNVPDAPSETCLVRITALDVADLTDTSDAVFTITNAPYIIVTAPNGGESWVVGSLHAITWISEGVGDVKLEYSTDYGTTVNEIVTSTANTGTYSWTIPDAVSNVCLVRVSAADGGDPADVTDSPFSIVAAASPAVPKTGYTKVGKLSATPMPRKVSIPGEPN